MKRTRGKWLGKKYDFYLIEHEHLLCVQEAGCRGEGDEVQVEHEVVVGAAIFMGDRDPCASVHFTLQFTEHLFNRIYFLNQPIFYVKVASSQRFHRSWIIKNFN